MVFREILLAVGDAVQKVDGNGLINTLVLSHAEQLVFHGDQHKSAGAHQNGQPVGTDVPGNRHQFPPGCLVPFFPHDQCRSAHCQFQYHRSDGTGQQRKHIQHKKAHGGHDPCAEPVDHAERQHLHHIGLFPPNAYGQCCQDNAQQYYSCK